MQGVAAVRGVAAVHGVGKPASRAPLLDHPHDLGDLGHLRRGEGRRTTAAPLLIRGGGRGRGRGRGRGEIEMVSALLEGEVGLDPVQQRRRHAGEGARLPYRGDAGLRTGTLAQYLRAGSCGLIQWPRRSADARHYTLLISHLKPTRVHYVLQCNDPHSRLTMNASSTTASHARS